MRQFIMLIGGPGKFFGCDKAHDQSWSNYIVPMQLAALRDDYSLQSDEKVHWLVHKPSYAKRWADDSVITPMEKKQDDGYHLHSVRLNAARKVLARSAGSYLQRIEQIAKKNNIVFKSIEKPDDFWNYIASMDKGSISRCYYSGHAAGNGLMLRLVHDSQCTASAYESDMVKLSSIQKASQYKDRFDAKTKQVSKFIGCYTAEFACEWHKVFGVAAAGAKNKVDFSVIDKASAYKNIIERIEKTNTSHGATGWTEYR